MKLDGFKKICMVRPYLLTDETIVDMQNITLAALTAAKGDGWLPIESAPNDGKPYLYAIEVCQAPDTMFWYVYYLYRDESGDLREINGDYFTDWEYSDFSFWKHLDEPPQDGGGDDER